MLIVKIDSRKTFLKIIISKFLQVSSEKSMKEKSVGRVEVAQIWK